MNQNKLLSLLFASGAAIAGCSSGDGSNSGPTPHVDGGTDDGGIDSAPSEDVRVLTGRDEKSFCDFYATKHVDTATTVTSGGDATSCTPGTITPEALVDVRLRVDWFRELVGLPKVKEPIPALNAKAQACAIIMAVRQELSHTPPKDWACYTDDGAYAAGHSNIALANVRASDAVDSFMFDWKNNDTIGHRRWLLNPSLAGLGYGYFDGGKGGPYGEKSGMCLVVFDDDHPDTSFTSDEPIAYPSPGAFPAAWTSFDFEGAQLSPWSLSWKDADFSKATLTLRDGKTKAVLATAPDGEFKELAKGYGMNTARWVPARTPVVGDSIEVRVEGVVRKGAVEKPVVYTVDIVDCGVTFDP